MLAVAVNKTDKVLALIKTNLLERNGDVEAAKRKINIYFWW